MFIRVRKVGFRQSVFDKNPGTQRSGNMMEAAITLVSAAQEQ